MPPSSHSADVGSAANARHHRSVSARHQDAGTTAVRTAVESFAQDFGYDLDEEGQPLEDDAPLAAAKEPQAA